MLLYLANKLPVNPNMSEPPLTGGMQKLPDGRAALRLLKA